MHLVRWTGTVCALQIVRKIGYPVRQECLTYRNVSLIYRSVRGYFAAMTASNREL